MKKKLVTNLLDNICLCRDMIERGNMNELTVKIYIFDIVANEVKRQVNKYIDDKNHELDFTTQDLYELSDEIHHFLKKLEPEFDYDSIMKRISTYVIVNDSVIEKETNRLADYMYVDRKLRECYKLLSYLAMILQLWTESQKGV